VNTAHPRILVPTPNALRLVLGATPWGGFGTGIATVCSGFEAKAWESANPLAARTFAEEAFGSFRQESIGTTFRIRQRPVAIVPASGPGAAKRTADRT